MSIQGTLYNALFKRSSTFALAVVSGAFFFERALDLGSVVLYEKLNEGKLYKHIKSNNES